MTHLLNAAANSGDPAPPRASAARARLGCAPVPHGAPQLAPWAPVAGGVVVFELLRGRGVEVCSVRVEVSEQSLWRRDILKIISNRRPQVSTETLCEDLQ
jgi:hypothetical protein